MTTDRLTWFGLAVAILGWIVLIADAALGPLSMAAGGSLAVTAMLRSDIFSLAETAIFSGFALAVLGVLRSGFGALRGFFDAVLERADAPRPSPSPVVSVDVPSAAPTVEVRVPRSMDTRPTRGKNYTILDNGAVEVETLLGTRVFASLQEARDYIR